MKRSIHMRLQCLKMKLMIYIHMNQQYVELILTLKKMEK